MKMQALGLLLAAVFTSGCYHATIETGRPSSGTTESIPWAHGFVYGLVPPSTVNAATKCPNGVAKVETQLSFLNQVASILTFGIYTPMQIDVTCAASGSASRSVTAGDDVPAAFARAIELSRAAGEAVEIHF